MALKHIQLEKKDRIALATLNRPDVLNALNAQLMSDLDSVVSDVSGDPEVGVLIITGSGDKAFAAGADISELAKQDPIGGAETSRRGQAILRRLETMGKPSVAAVNGFALGGGCEPWREGGWRCGRP